MSDSENAQAAAAQHQAQTVVYTNDLAGIKPPSFDWDSPNLPQQFRNFRRYCELLLSTPTYGCRKEHEVNYILLWMGPQAVNIFDNWTHLTNEQRKSPSHVWDAFSTYFEPKTNFRLSRFHLRDMTQQNGEPVDSYITRLRSQAQKCNFDSPETTDDNLLDQFIKGVAHRQVRKQLLDQDPNKLKLDKAVDYARTFEATQLQLEQLGHDVTVSAVTHKRRDMQRHTANCPNCGGSNHNREQCPANGKECNKCHKTGHYGKVCRSFRKQPQKQPHNVHHQRNTKQANYKQNVNSVDCNAIEHLPGDFDNLMFSTIAIDYNNIDQSTAYATLCIEPYSNRTTNLRGKVDTGAEGNILPLRTYRQLFPAYVDKQGLPTKATPSDVVMSAYGGATIPQHGTINIPCRYRDSQWHNTTFYISDTNGPVIFGLPVCNALGLVKLNCAINTSHGEKPKVNIESLDDLKLKYPDRFTGIGKFPGVHKLTLIDNTTPVIHPPRRAPIQLRENIKAELDRMVSLDVIRPVEEPTDWVSSITYVRKRDGTLRICLDPKDINAVLKRGQHHIPTLEELTHRFANAAVFSKLDAKSGYWSVQLDPDSQLLTTFNSPFGRYCFKRLPFGLKTSQDVFQHAMDRLLEGLPGVVSIADDITVYGKDEQDHDNNLHLLMQRARDRGLVFNSSKCQIKAKEIPFFGNIYSKDGVRPDPSKVQAITDLKPPTNVTEMQSFLGMVTYIAAYIPNLSEHTAPLRQLLHKDIAFQWNPEQQSAFDNLKELICSANALSYFDPKKPVVIQVDASQRAIGAALTQQDKLIAFASKSLSNTEQNYANIERELLACVFGAERFHTYLFGKPFMIQSDHKPLEMITKKTLSAAPARLQRMLLRLQRYDYCITYRPGKEMVLADSLSRLPSKQDAKEIQLDTQVCFVQFSSERLQELRDSTSCDRVLCILQKYIMHGFPEKKREVHSSVRAYWAFRDELSIEDGMILKGNQIIIPSSLQYAYLERIHEGHQGITRCQQRARASIYWPGINNDIERIVTKCFSCQKHQPLQPKEPLESVVPDVPNIPWHTLSTDLFTFHGQEYLIIADYHSKFPIVQKLSSDSTSNAVASVTNKVICMFGIPTRIISDNGPQFIGKPYKDLIHRHGIAHITSSPLHPKSHGFIERTIRTIKGLMTKSTDCEQALLSYRTTPLGPQMPSPAELLFNRKIPSNLPIHIKVQVSDAFRRRQEDRNHNATTAYNEHSRELTDLQLDERVYYRDVAQRTWLPGKVIGVGPEPRSYTIKCNATGRSLRRNRVLLRPRATEIQLAERQLLPSQIIPAIQESNNTQYDIQPNRQLQHPQPAPESATPQSATQNIETSATHNPASKQQCKMLQPIVATPSPRSQPSAPNQNRTRSGRTIRPTTRLIEHM